MMGEQLRELASKVRNGEPVDWSAELAGQALDQAATDADFAQELGEYWNERITESGSVPGLPGIGGEGSEIEEDAGG